ncbi:beta-phosphoglucomutase family hydrolase [Ruania zhangjianzhongii]|uniref:beta-phosphoglucomutase family hydrolase n=1 Tax=Ruania zhangjianzhongii TaxID=2603206 RepID=UPI0011C8A78E|nr:beta-phosphoglucomutase family hydrolase [Ruania zhangjianzhongii]
MISPTPNALRALGLPPSIRACLFDLDGVITQTASLHFAAWKHTFDAILADLGQAAFTSADYAAHVDGRRRYDGVRTFLQSRGISRPEGTPQDPPEADTICGIGNRKNADVQRILAEDGVETFPGTVRYLAAVREAGLATAIVTASANGQAVVESAGLAAEFDARIDGVVAAEHNLPGKPAPDTFLAGAAELGVDPSAAVVIEDAIAGVQAGHAGAFGYVIGVDRLDHAEALAAAGADVVVTDLADLLSDQVGSTLSRPPTGVPGPPADHDEPAANPEEDQ